MKCDFYICHLMSPFAKGVLRDIYLLLKGHTLFEMLGSIRARAENAKLNIERFSCLPPNASIAKVALCDIELDFQVQEI